MNEPNVMYQGNSYAWITDSTVYTPDEGFALTYYFNGAMTGSCTGSYYNGTQFVVTASAALTNTLTVGTYTLVGLVSSGADRYTLSTTILEVKQNPATAPVGYDARSHAQRTLDLIKTAIESVSVDGGVVSLSIAGRSKTNYSIGELLKLKSYYEAQVEAEEAKERIQKGQPGKSQIFIRF